MRRSESKAGRPVVRGFVVDPSQLLGQDQRLVTDDGRRDPSGQCQNQMAQDEMGAPLNAMQRGIGVVSRDRREEGSTDFSRYFEPLGTVGAVDRTGVDFSGIAGGTGEGGEAGDKALHIACQLFLKEDQRRLIKIMFGRPDHGHEFEIISTP